MYEYKFEPVEDIHIDTSSFCKSVKEIKQENMSMTPECICVRYIYPNGFIMEVEQYAGRFVLRTNRELIDGGNGTFCVSEK